MSWPGHKPAPMDDSIRVMVEVGKKKRVVACALDWSGWDRSAKTEEDALRILAAYRPRYANVAALAGLADGFGATGDFAVVERVEGNGMTDYYGVSGRRAEPEQEQISEAACERKIALLRAAWASFDDVASRVSPELRKGPRGGGCDRDEIVRHTNASEFGEFARKVGVRTPPDAGGPRRSPRPPRGVLGRDPRVQRPWPVGRPVDGPVPDSAPRLAHARPRVGRWRIGTCPLPRAGDDSPGSSPRRGA